DPLLERGKRLHGAFTFLVGETARGKLKEPPPRARRPNARVVKRLLSAVHQRPLICETRQGIRTGAGLIETSALSSCTSLLPGPSGVTSSSPPPARPRPRRGSGGVPHSSAGSSRSTGRPCRTRSALVPCSQVASGPWRGRTSR